jgi:hypothetical protein
MKLFEHVDTASGNDPDMINLRGAKVQVPASQVSLLLKKGFILVDKTWRPKLDEKPQEDIVRDAPLPRSQLLEKTQQELDTLEVWEI